MVKNPLQSKCIQDKTQKRKKRAKKIRDNRHSCHQPQSEQYSNQKSPSNELHTSPPLSWTPSTQEPMKSIRKHQKTTKKSEKKTSMNLAMDLFDRAPSITTMAARVSASEKSERRAGRDEKRVENVAKGEGCLNRRLTDPGIIIPEI